MRPPPTKSLRALGRTRIKRALNESSEECTHVESVVSADSCGFGLGFGDSNSACGIGGAQGFPRSSARE